MLKVRTGISESYRNIERPVILASVKAFLSFLNMDKNCKVYYNGEAEVSKLIGSNRAENDGGVDDGFSPRIYVEKETEDAGWMDGLDNTNRYDTTPPFWYDPITKSSIRPLFKGKRTTITINRYFPDRVIAERFEDAIETYLRSSSNSTFNCNVHFPLTNDIIVLLSDIYNLLVKGGKVDSNETNSLEWIKTCSCVPWDIIVNVAGKNPAFVFKQRLEEIGLNFQDVKIGRVKSKGAYNGQWIVSFTYDFYHAVFNGYQLYYPMVIQQQMLPSIWIPKAQQLNLDPYATRRFYSNEAGHIAFDYLKYKAPFYHVFPIEDNYRVPEEYWLDIKVQRLALMENKENQVVLNLFKFNGEENFWLPKYREYISRFANKITKRHRNPMHLKIWCNDIAVHENNIELLPNGDLVMKTVPHMDCIYRVGFYLDKAVHLYSDDAVDDITNCDNKEYGKWILEQVIPEIPIPGDSDYYGDSQYEQCPWIDWDKDITDKVNKGDGSSDNHSGKPLYMARGMIIAKNERYLNRRLIEDSVLDFSMTKYLRRKNNG